VAGGNGAERPPAEGKDEAGGVDGGTTYISAFATALLTSAQEYMQPITDSARGMVNTVYDGLLNGK
jgi:hypothetical protein